MTFSYYMTQRPPMPGALPKEGLLRIEAREPWKRVPGVGRAYALLTYDRQLTDKEIADYELAADPDSTESR